MVSSSLPEIKAVRKGKPPTNIRNNRDPIPPHAARGEPDRL